jgi:imidazolonepropionase-like amidohydrolase
VITMAGLKPGPIAGTPGVIESATVLIEDNRIVSVGPAASIQVPGSARRVDVKGQTIMPGIVDVHGHLRRRGERAARAIALAARRESRVRRDDVARSVERHGDGIQQR